MLSFKLIDKGNFMLTFVLLYWTYHNVETLVHECLVLYSHNNGPRREKTCLRGFGHNKGADQPAHPHRLISTFVIRLLESIISILAMSEISNI